MMAVCCFCFDCRFYCLPGLLFLDLCIFVREHAAAIVTHMQDSALFLLWRAITHIQTAPHWIGLTYLTDGLHSSFSFLRLQLWTCSFVSLHLHGTTSSAVLSAAAAGVTPQDTPMYKSAVDYVSSVKKAYENNPQVYKDFMTVLESYNSLM